MKRSYLVALSLLVLLGASPLVAQPTDEEVSLEEFMGGLGDLSRYSEPVFPAPVPDEGSAGLRPSQNFAPIESPADYRVAPGVTPPTDEERAGAQLAPAFDPVRGRGQRAAFDWSESVASPTLRVLVDHVTVLALPVGEVVREAFVGDGKRFEVKEGYAGPEGGEWPALSIRSKKPGARSNLVILTDRRAYSLELVSPELPPSGDPVVYTEVAVFRLVDAGFVRSNYRPAPSPAAMPEAEGDAEVVVEPALHFGYTLELPRKKRHRLDVEPRVYDDGQTVTVRLTESAVRRFTPTLVGVDAAGREFILNFSTERENGQGIAFRVDGLVDHLRLRKDSRWIDIRRSEGGWDD